MSTQLLLPAILPASALPALLSRTGCGCVRQRWSGVVRAPSGLGSVASSTSGRIGGLQAEPVGVSGSSWDSVLRLVRLTSPVTSEMARRLYHA